MEIHGFFHISTALFQISDRQDKELSRSDRNARNSSETRPASQTSATSDCRRNPTVLLSTANVPKDLPVHELVCTRNRNSGGHRCKASLVRWPVITRARLAISRSRPAGLAPSELYAALRKHTRKRTISLTNSMRIYFAIDTGYTWFVYSRTLSCYAKCTPRSFHVSCAHHESMQAAVLSRVCNWGFRPELTSQEISPFALATQKLMLSHSSCPASAPRIRAADVSPAYIAA